jgi:nitrogen fixation-related uncharacterized protein
MVRVSVRVRVNIVAVIVWAIFDWKMGSNGFDGNEQLEVRVMNDSDRAPSSPSPSRHIMRMRNQIMINRMVRRAAISLDRAVRLLATNRQRQRQRRKHGD